LGPLFWTLIVDLDMGHPHLGHRLRTPIWDTDLGPHVISKIKQNSSDINEIILAPCYVISKIKQNSSDMNESYDAGYVQSCTGLK
jgi:hypothetical protein